MSDPNFGVVVRRISDEVKPPVYGTCSIPGIIGPAPDADPDIFPIDTPVAFNSTDTAYTAHIGESGFILDAVRGINDQLGPLQSGAMVVFIRTEEGTGSGNTKLKGTMANIMGNSALGTGIWAFTQAAELVHAIPRLICAPGYTGAKSNILSTITRGTAGTNYVNGQTYQLTVTGGGSDAIQGTAHAVGQSDGKLGPAVIDTAGGFYTSAPTITAPPPPSSGTTATYTATIDETGNPVIAAFPPVLNALLATSVVETAGTSKADDLDTRSTIDSDRIMLVSGGVRVVDPVSGDVVVRPRAAREIGLIIRRDAESGGRPFKSAANQPMYGIVGPSRRFSFNITNGENEGQELLEANVGILIQGEVGNDFAISDGGYISILTDNCGDDELWRFYNQVRGRDWINIALIRSWRQYIGKFNITEGSVRAVTGALNVVLRDAQANDDLLGYKIGFKGTLNSAEEIRKGHITISFKAEEPPVLKRITGIGGRYREAVDALVANLESQLAIAA